MENAGVTRKLAVILAADVAGYSRLMAVDEEGTLALLNARRQVTDELIGRHHGRIFGTAGDSVMAEFASAVEAVRCAAGIQQENQRRNADLPEHRRMLFRVGVNLGDVMVGGDDLLGDGVNVAARLESMAQPGGICISSAVYDQIRNKVDLSFDDLGERTLKNIGYPVRVFGLRRDGANEAKPAQEHRAPVVPRPPALPSIAVLPFTNIGGHPEQDYFADGLTEDLITELSRFQELRVLVEKAQRLNPVPPRWYWWFLGFALYVARRYDDAVIALRKGRPPAAMAYRWLALCYGQLGRELDARAAVEEYLKRTPDFSLAAHLETIPFQHAQDREHYIEGLRKAGLAE